MTAISNSTQTTVIYRGHSETATFDKTSGKWYVEIDGKRVVVDPNDLFGMNNDSRIEKFDEEIKEGKAMVAKYCTLFDNALESVRGYRRNFNDFLRENEVSSLHDLSGEEYEEGKEIYDNRNNAVTAKNRYLAKVLQYTHSVVSACCSKRACC